MQEKQEEAEITESGPNFKSLQKQGEESFL